MRSPSASPDFGQSNRAPHRSVEWAPRERFHMANAKSPAWRVRWRQNQKASRLLPTPTTTKSNHPAPMSEPGANTWIAIQALAVGSDNALALSVLCVVAWHGAHALPLHRAAADAWERRQAQVVRVAHVGRELCRLCGCSRARGGGVDVRLGGHLCRATVRCSPRA